MAIKLDVSLRKEYQDLFDKCQPSVVRLKDIQAVCLKIQKNKPTYQKIGFVPWHIVGVIHQMESSGNFKTHLHNGDPLSDRTVQVPKGRPIQGNPPYDWDYSARDALHDRQIPEAWTVADTLFYLEGYNGFGYRINYPEVKSPYLWASSNCYTTGKYKSDGHFDSSVISTQLGAAVMLKYMLQQGWITFNGLPNPSINPNTTVIKSPPTIETPAKKETGVSKNVKPSLMKILVNWFSSSKPNV